MKKYSLAIFLIFLITLSGVSQNSRDVVYLKNGSVVKGNITEMNPTENIKIQTADGSLFVYKMSDVQKMEKEEFVGREMKQETSSSVSQEAIDSYFKDFLSKERPALNFIGVSKKNGIKKEVNGQKKYELEYELIMQAEKDIYVNTSGLSAFARSFNEKFEYTLQNTSGYEAAMTGSKDRIDKGQRIVANGTIVFEETDNGWRATYFKNENFKTVSANYITPEMAEKIKVERQQQKVERQQLTERKKQEGEWKEDDIPEVNFQTIYLKAENVPVFKNVVYNISVKTLPNHCNDCRNDNIAAIQEATFQALKEVNRYSNIDKATYNSEENLGKISIIISSIDFDYQTDFDSNGNGGEGFSCKIRYSIASQAYLTNPQDAKLNNTKVYFASTKLKNYYTHKKYAFQKALEELKDNLNEVILKQEPIELGLVSIVLDKKNKVDKLIFKKPIHFFNAKKMKFIILKKGDIVFNDDHYSFKDKIAECKFKGDMSATEIVCDVSGGRNKKALAEFVGNTESVIAINTGD